MLKESTSPMTQNLKISICTLKCEPLHYATDETIDSHRDRIFGLDLDPFGRPLFEAEQKGTITKHKSTMEIKNRFIVTGLTTPLSILM